ncbi:MAG: PocR ligand-binding domain-containing protein [Nitrospirota bacterium]
MRIDEYDFRDIADKEITDLVGLMLDLFSETTNCVIAIYDIEGKGRWSSPETLFSPLCTYCHHTPRLWDLCEIDHKKRTSERYFAGSDGPTTAMCHFGLWNISHPIYMGEKFYGAIITGQRKLSAIKASNESNTCFEERLGELKEKELITMSEAENLRTAFNSVAVLDEFPALWVQKMADIDNRLLQLIQNVLYRIERRMKRLTLLRHELHDPNISVRNNLLRCILMLEELLRNDIIDSKMRIVIKETVSYLKYTKNWSSLFSAIIENISSAMSREVIKPNIKRANIIAILEDVISLFQEHADKKDVEFETIDTAHLYVKNFEMDPSLIARTFINVYHNAVKYSYYGQKNLGPRKIETKCKDIMKFFRIEVSNYGIGILKEELQSGSIWEEGVRGKLSSDRHRTGSGLGLPQVKKIIEAHNGQVEIRSSPLGDDLITGPYLTTLQIDLPYYYQAKNNGEKQ